jgi:ATP-dependent exoDNAse (exonuclease V) alpha subunit
MSGLQPVVFLAKGTKVMLIMNFWPSVGLCNGTTGTIIDFIYQVEQQERQQLPLRLAYALTINTQESGAYTS